MKIKPTADSISIFIIVVLLLLIAVLLMGAC